MLNQLLYSPLWLSVYCLIPKLSDVITDGIYYYCAVIDLTRSEHDKFYFKSIVIIFSILLKVLGYVLFMPFLPPSWGVPVHWTLATTYGNLVLFLYFHILSWRSALESIKESSRLISLENPPPYGASCIHRSPRQPHATTIFVIMPCYRELEDVLMGSILSVVNSEYPKNCIHLMLSFDGHENRPVFDSVVKKLGAEVTNAAKTQPSAVVNNVNVTIAIFQHGGKKACQARSLNVLQSRFNKQLANHDGLFVMLLDSDTRMMPNAFQVFSNMMQYGDANNHRIDAITSNLAVTDAKDSWMGTFEEIDFLHHGLLYEMTASSLGSVLCACGTHTFVRLSVLLRICDAYCSTATTSYYDYWLQNLGDDRWFTDLVSADSAGQNRLVFMPEMLCSTMTVQPFWPLLTQRRRWLLATISSDAFANLNYPGFLSNPQLWLYRITLQTIRLQDVYPLFLALVLHDSGDQKLRLLSLMVLMSFILTWSVLGWISVRHGRYAIVFYPFNVILFPLWSVAVRVYTVLTLQKQFWGGVRLKPR